LRLLASNGGETVTGPVEVTAASPTQGVFLDASEVPAGSGPVTVRYWLGSPGARVHLGLFTAQGRLVRWIERGPATAGEHVLSWDRRNESGSAVPRGVYFLSLAVDGASMTRKTVLWRR
jgi:flagellar hook assembly protein FlgD